MKSGKYGEIHWKLHVVFATVPDCDFRSGSGSELNDCQLGDDGCQFTQTINSGMVRCKSPNQSEIASLLEGRPAGPSVGLYDVHVVAVG